MLLSAHSMRSPLLGCLPITQFITFSTNTSLVTVCILPLNLVVTLAKLLLVLVFSVEDTSAEPILFHDSLFESLLLMIICDVFSISILIYLHCSRVGKLFNTI